MKLTRITHSGSRVSAPLLGVQKAGEEEREGKQTSGKETKVIPIGKDFSPREPYGDFFYSYDTDTSFSSTQIIIDGIPASAILS